MADVKVAKASRGRAFVSVGDSPVVIPGIGMKDLSEEVIGQVKGLLKIRDAAGGLEVSRNQFVAGRALLPGYEVVVPPQLPMRTFLGLLTYGLGLPLSVDVSRAIASSHRANGDAFLQIVAALLIAEAESLMRGHISQDYVQREERLQLLRGRPLWHKDLAQPRGTGIVCRYRQKDTDNLLNRLIVSGIAEAARISRDGSLHKRASTQSFIWRSLAEPIVGVRAHHFASALAGLNRQTEPYRSALLLAQVLLLGIDPPGTYNVGNLLAPLPRFDLAQLFERVTARLVKDVALRHGVETRTQHTRADALVDATGDTYRRVRPDLVLFRKGVPVAVMDAKYKPRYTAYRERTYRVSSADLYQMFFYAERVSRLYHLPTAVPAFVLAPRLEGRDPHVPDSRRRIFWDDAAGGATRTSLSVIPVDISELAEAALVGSDATKCSPDLVRRIAEL